MSSWLFPPRTREVQFDEKWSFVGKKEKHCRRDQPADDTCGDCWDHVALDPEHRLVVSLLVGRRTPELVALLVEDFHKRTEGRVMDLMTSDEYPPYASAILSVYGETAVPERTGRPGRPRVEYRRVPQDLVYATVHKVREDNRVVSVEERLIYGTPEQLAEALANSPVTERVTTVHIERYNGTDRHRNARKVRKTYRFSKDWEVHEAVTCFVAFSANFCKPVRTLRQKLRRKEGKRKWRQRTPAMAAGLTDHVWSIAEWISRPSVQRE
jgi:IS1 family transposase